MAKFQLREVRVVGIPQFSSKIAWTIMMLITKMNIYLNFTIRTSWTWRGLETVHLPFLRKSVRCTVCLSSNVTYLKDFQDIANNIKFNKQVSTSVKLMKVWCNIILGIQEREKPPHKKYKLGTRDCGRSKIAWKGGCFLTLWRITSPTQGPTSPYKQSLSVQKTIEDYYIDLARTKSEAHFNKLII